MEVISDRFKFERISALESFGVRMSESKSEAATKSEDALRKAMLGFEAARQESIDFLSGKVDKTSWPHASVRQEAKTSADSNFLIAVNKLGLLVVSSQSGTFGRNEINGNEERKKKLHEWANQHEQCVLTAVSRAAYIETRRRAIIECICLLSDMAQITQALVDEQLWVQADGETFGGELEVIDLTILSV